jgi:hypothetical protein
MHRNPIPMEQLNISDDTKNDSGGVGVSTSFPPVMTLSIGGRKVQIRPTLSVTDPATSSASSPGSGPGPPDPDLFAHLLRFMRRREIFPL